MASGIEMHRYLNDGKQKDENDDCGYFWLKNYAPCLHVILFKKECIHVTCFTTVVKPPSIHENEGKQQENQSKNNNNAVMEK